MGSELWFHFTPYRVNAEEALRELKERVIREGAFRSFGTKEEMIRDLQESIRRLEEGNAESDEDLREHLLNEYRQQLETLSNLPEPKTLEEKIQEIMTINGSEGTSSPLDIFGVSDAPAFFQASPLPEEEIREAFGTTEPTRDQIEANIGDVAAAMDRGFALYVIAYDEGKPSEICFTGWSCD